MKRSAQPLPSGARTKAGELSAPRERSSFWKSPALYCEPWSWRTARPRATSFANPPNGRRTPDSRAKRNGLSEADLDVPAKLLEQRLEGRQEAEALAGRRVVAEHD